MGEARVDPEHAEELTRRAGFPSVGLERMADHVVLLRPDKVDRGVGHRSRAVAELGEEAGEALAVAGVEIHVRSA